MSERRNGGGVVAHTQKWGGDPFAAEGRAILYTPPQCVFGTFPKWRKYFGYDHVYIEARELQCEVENMESCTVIFKKGLGGVMFSYLIYPFTIILAN